MSNLAVFERALNETVGAITGKAPIRDDKSDYHSVSTLSDFKTEFWPGYEHAAHQVAIDDKLMQVAAYIKSDGREGIGRLMIFMPPRHGKCIAKGTLVTLASGERKPLEEICPRDMVVSLSCWHNTTDSAVI